MKGQEVVQGLVGKSRLFLRKNSGTILTGIGVLGVVSTTVAALEAGPKAVRLLKEAEEEKGEKLTKLEIVKVAAPIYIPTVVLGVSTITCIVGANVVNKQKQTSLMSAYAVLDKSYKQYKGKVRELLGDDASREIQDEIIKDEYKDADIDEIEDNKILFYDELTRQYFESDLYTVQRAEYLVNRDINTRGWSLLSDYCEALDIPVSEYTEVLGWADGINFARYWQGWVDFNHRKVTLEDGLECIIISTFQEPYTDYEGC